MSPHDYPVDSADARERREEIDFGEVTVRGMNPDLWPDADTYGYRIGDWVVVARVFSDSPAPKEPRLVKVTGAVSRRITESFQGWLMFGSEHHGQPHSFYPVEAVHVDEHRRRQAAISNQEESQR